MTCATCNGRGWVKAPPGTSTWAEACPTCELSALGTVGIAKHLGVHRRDVYRVRTMQAGPKVSERVFRCLVLRAPGAF